MIAVTCGVKGKIEVAEKSTNMRNRCHGKISRQNIHVELVRSAVVSLLSHFTILN
jgi:hypothetical protein